MPSEPSADVRRVRSATDAAIVLALEATAVHVVGSLRQAGVDPLLVKGPVTNRWLYGDPLARRFQDVDLLVDPRLRAAAETVLGESGFIKDHARVLGIHRPAYESSWSRDGRSIDLHTRLAGIPPALERRAWQRLSAEAEPFTLHNREMRTLNAAARTMLLGLHAARSGADSQALRDLSRGLGELPDALWLDAATLARDLEADACFVVGLQRLPEGGALLERLAVSARPTLESSLLADEAPHEALILAEREEAGLPIGATAFRELFTTEVGHAPRRAVLGAMARYVDARRVIRRHEALLSHK